MEGREHGMGPTNTFSFPRHPPQEHRPNRASAPEERPVYSTALPARAKLRRSDLVAGGLGDHGWPLACDGRSGGTGRSAGAKWAWREQLAINRSPRWGWGGAGAANRRVGGTRQAVGGGWRAESMEWDQPTPFHSNATHPRNTVQTARQLQRSGLFIEPSCRRDPSSVGATWWPGCWATTAGRWDEMFAQGGHAAPLELNGLGVGTWL